MPRAKPQISLYLDYEAKQQRAPLFACVAAHTRARSALYAGSYVHIAPSLFVPEVAYVDLDKRCPRFFADPGVAAHIQAHRTYDEPAVFRFHHADFHSPLPEPDAHFDLLISQFSGLISQGCAQYLRVGGHLLANDSHGDAGVAHLDPRYALVATLEPGPDGWVLSEDDLDTFFVPRRASDPRTIEGLRAHGKGLKYTRMASQYLFQRVG